MRRIRPRESFLNPPVRGAHKSRWCCEGASGDLPMSRPQCPPFRGDRPLYSSELGFRLWQILLKRSPLAHERNFAAPLVRPTLGDVRDYIDSRKSDQ
jgi:hypothetical protein